MRVFHKAHRTPYHVENSIRGIRKAKRAGYAGIDLDLQITKDGVIVNTHWPRPMMRDGFRDPKRKLRRWRTVGSMTWAEVSRLRAPGGYRINTLDRALAECARVGITAVVEPKGDKRFLNQAVWDGIKASANRHHARITGYTLLANSRALTFMNKAGVPSHPLKH